MSILDFLTDFALTGQVEGAGLHSTPEEWEQHLGSDFLDDRRKNQFRRDYGIVELGFWRVDGAWKCGLISVQTYRLWYCWENTGPAKIRKKYGDFPKVVQFAELSENLRKFDNEPVFIDDEVQYDHGRYYVPRTKVSVIAIAAPDGGHDGRPDGSLWQLSHAENAELWIRPRKAYKK